MPDMTYEEKEITLEAGQTVLFHSDGLVEAHNPQGEMFGFPRLQSLMAEHPGGAQLVEFLLAELEKFTGPDWEQEDDVNLVTLEYQKETTAGSPENGHTLVRGMPMENMAHFTLPSQRGNERQAMEEVAAVIQNMNLPDSRLEKLKTAVAEATMNAMEHGNKYDADLPVEIDVLASGGAVVVRITDQGGGAPIPETKAPDLEAKLAGQQSPRGWGLFLIKNMVDEMNITSDNTHHTIELIMNLEEGE
jgi:anti-sigma regulatory factor (Ser/Thr protein kinase)